MKIPIAFLVLASALPAVCDPSIRCTDALCLNFRQEVATDHRHLHRDTDATCLNFQQFVPANHQHVHRNRDVTSPHFLEYAPDKRRRARQ